MKRFGNVIRDKIPDNKETRRRLGFAIVGFEKEEQASRALAEGEINVEMACLRIVKATMVRRTERPRDGLDAKTEFSKLKRN